MGKHPLYYSDFVPAWYHSYHPRLEDEEAQVTSAHATPGSSSMMHGTRSGYNNGCRWPPCTAANTQAQRTRRRSLASQALSGAQGWENPGIQVRMNESTANRSVGGGGVNLFAVLSAAAETFFANHAATVAARTAAGTHGPAVTPVVAARPTSSRSPAPQFLPPPPPQVSRFMPPGCPAHRLIANCGCPFGWGTPDIPIAVRCPRHGRQPVLSSRVVRNLDRPASRGCAGMTAATTLNEVDPLAS